jgi:hypothetical protein
LSPLTERILARAPGPYWLFVGLWALVPWLNAGGNLLLGEDARSAVWEQRGTLVFLSYAALSAAVLLALWGSRRIARQLDAVAPVAEKVLDGADAAVAFREVDSVAGPLALAAATATVFAVNAFVEDGWLPALLRGSTWLVLGVAIATFLWTYASLQLGLNRLAGRPVRARASLDPGLGLRPLGNIAFVGLWMLLAWLVPVLLTALPDVLAVTIGAVVLAAALAAFLLSVFRLHRRMVEIKAHELALARDLYARAYEPLWTTPTLGVLEQQHRLLSAAEGLERRALAIHDWPVDEGTFARVLTIVTSVVGITIARLILDPFGL